MIRQKCQYMSIPVLLLSVLLGTVGFGCGADPAVSEIRRNRPEPAARHKSAYQPIRESDDFDRIDRHATTAPASVEDSIDELARYLTQKTQTDAEKARVIFRWITLKIDYETDEGYWEYPPEICAEQAFKRRSAVCNGYSSLFEALAERSGLEIVRIRGYSKGDTYYPGKRFSAPNHEWNGVKIDGRWYLIDATWGSGFIKKGRFARKFDDYYFLTPPEYFIFDHFPEDPKWQLLPRPVTKSEFEARPYPGRPQIRSFCRYGFPGKTLWELAGRSDFTGFPRTHEQGERRILISEAPLQKGLAEEAPYNFTIRSPEAAEVVLINKGDWGEKWIDLQPLGNDRFTGEIRPRKGELRLSAKFPDKPGGYWPLLVYGVEKH